MALSVQVKKVGLTGATRYKRPCRKVGRAAQSAKTNQTTICIFPFFAI